MSPSRRRAPGAVRGLASRAPHRAPSPHSHERAPLPCGPVAVGRDVLIAPPRHRRGARLGIPNSRRGWARWSAAGAPDSRPTASTPAKIAPMPNTPHHRRASRLAPPLPTRITRGALPGRRDRDIAPYRHYTRVVRTACVPSPRPIRSRCCIPLAPSPCPVAVPIAVSPCGRARWSAAAPPGSRRHLRTRNSHAMPREKRTQRR